MLYSTRLRELMGRLMGERTLREVALEVGCDHTLLHNIRSEGRIPRRESIRRIADGLKLTGDVRAELFAAAGYIEVEQEAAA